MSSKHLVVRIIAVLAAMITLVGCAVPVKSPVEPTTDMKPTFNAIATESAQTVVADLTKNAPTATPVMPTEAPTNTLAPTDTAAPTFTPVPPTNTPTLVVWTVTPRATATYSYNCTINLSLPAYGASYDKNAPFDGKWTVTNTGEKTWSKEEVDFKYLSGTKFQEHVDIVDVTSDVAKGSSYTVIIDMLAPKSSGRYSAAWAFVQGSIVLCPVYVTINVK